MTEISWNKPYTWWLPQRLCTRKKY